MEKMTVNLEFNSEELEALKLAVGYFIDDNEKCILDDMKDSARKDRQGQLHYHMMLTLLYNNILYGEQRLVEKQQPEIWLNGKRPPQ